MKVGFEPEAQAYRVEPAEAFASSNKIFVKSPDKGGLPQYFLDIDKKILNYLKQVERGGFDSTF
jgi:hypothetical protein